MYIHFVYSVFLSGQSLSIHATALFCDGKAACSGPVGMAATRDNGHVDDKLLNADDD